MNTFSALAVRNTKLFFKDKGMFFTSLITPIILLVLYGTFLANIFKNTFRAALEGTVGVSESIVNGLVGGQLMSSLLSVSCVTVAFCANFLMVQDKVSGAAKDFLVSPVKKSALSLAYYFSTLAVTLIVCYTAMIISFIYIAFTGWYIPFSDMLLIIADVFILVMFGTALSSIINYFLSSQGQVSAVGTVISAGYGFICGAYMPISSFGEELRNTLGFFPGTYGTSLLRNHALNGVFDKMSSQNIPAEAINGIRDSVDCNLYFFGAKVEMWVMYLLLCGITFALICAYVIINKLCSGTKKK